MMKETYAKPIPDLNDPDMKPFWAASREKRLTAQLCGACQNLRFPPLPICPICLDEDSTWVDVSTSGTVWSYVVYHRAFHPGFADDIPYAVAIVENDDGVRYTGTIVGSRAGLAVGSRVEAVFDQATEEFTQVKWQVVEPSDV